MNCLLESAKIKVEHVEAEESTTNEQTTQNKSENLASDKHEVKTVHDEKRIQKLKTTSHKKGNRINKKTDDYNMSDKIEENEGNEEDEEHNSDLDKERKVKVRTTFGRKRRQSKKKPGDVKELSLGRRMASLNASAMMQVGIGSLY